MNPFRRISGSRRFHSDQRRSSPTSATSQPGISSKMWELYLEHTGEEDKNFMDSGCAEMDTLLLFATLFSAMQTAFVIETYSSLRVDFGEVAVQTLQSLLMEIHYNGTGSSGEMRRLPVAYSGSQPDASAVRLNAIWFTSLILSVHSAFLAILAKKWIFNVGRGLSHVPEARGRQQQIRYDTVHYWDLSIWLTSVSFLLHLSVLIFFVGLLVFLWNLNRTIAIAATCLISPAFLYYPIIFVMSTLTPVVPFWTSISSLLRTLLQNIYSTIMTPSSAIEVSLQVLERAFESMPLFAMQSYQYGFFRSLNDTWETFTSNHEDQYIAANYHNIDARALARMLRGFKSDSSSDENQSLALEISNFRSITEHRHIFIESGAVQFLARQLSWTCQSLLSSAHEANGDDRRQAQLPLLLLHFNALVRLLTEAEHNDHTRVTVESNKPIHVPLHYDHIIDLGTSVPKALVEMILDPHFKNMFKSHVEAHASWVRLHMLVTSRLITLPLTSRFTPEINGFDQLVDECAEDARGNSSRTQFTDANVVSLVNTAIYIVMAVWKSDCHSVLGPELGDIGKRIGRTLELFAKLLLHKRELGFPVRRQICWGIWMCSHNRFLPAHNLIPIVQTTEALGKPLAKCLSPEAGHSALPHAILALLERLLSDYEHLDCTDEERREHVRLLASLVQEFPRFLRAFYADLRRQLYKQTYLLKLLRRVISICGHLTYHNAHGISVDDLVPTLLSILLHVCEHIQEVRSDRAAICRLAFRTVCKVAEQQDASKTNADAATSPQSTSLAGAFAFDDECTVEDLAKTFAEVLEKVKHGYLPPFTSEKVGCMRALTSRSSFRHANTAPNLIDTICVYLSDPDTLPIWETDQERHAFVPAGSSVPEMISGNKAHSEYPTWSRTTSLRSVRFAAESVNHEVSRAHRHLPKS